MTRRPLRVLCVTRNSDRPEAETFIGLRARGVDVHLRCAPNARYLERIRDGAVPVEPLEFESKIDRRAIESIRGSLDELKPDILHLFDNRTVLNGLIAARGRDLKIVAYRGTMGNVSFLDPLSWMRYLNPRVDRIVCVSEAVRRYFLEMSFLGLKLPPEKPVTIHKGHDLAWYTDEPADLATLGIPSNAFVIGCVANWRPHKGIEVLVDACGSLAGNTDIHLLLVGNMNNEALRARIESSPMTDRIHRPGFRDDAPAVIAACDVSVLPSLRREGLPKTVIEAMAYSVPPIVTDCGGNPELVVDGESGFVVPVRDPAAIAAAIVKLYRDPELRSRCGHNARERIRNVFCIEKTIERTLAVYRSLVP